MNNIKPILFSGPMVRALLEGRKTMTRRVIKPQPPDDHRFVGIYGPGLTAVFEPLSRGDDYTVRLPYMPGQLLWVREGCAETWNVNDMKDWPRRPHTPTTDPQCVVIYRADGDWQWCDGDGFSTESSFWKPSIHMPRVWSRLTLEVTAVKVERLQEISEADAQAEGTPCYVCGGPMDGLSEADCHCFHRKATPHDFRNLWDSLNAKRGYGWEDNPYVTVVQFSVFKLNVDAFLAQRKAA